MIGRIQFAGKADLLRVGQVFCLEPALLHGRKDRQRDAGEDGDDRDHHQEFNEREG